jgi:heptosyltransferase-2
MKLALPYKDIRKVLVRGVNWIGDTVITLPSIKGIRSVFPDAYIAVLLYPHLSSLFGRCAFVDEVIPYPRARGFNLFLEERVLVKSIRQKQFDLAVILPRSFRSALIPYLARIPYRIGYNACQRGMLLTHRLKEKEKVLNCHQVEYYYHLVQSLGVAQPYELPNLFLGREEKGWAHRFLGDAGIDEGALLIGINPGSTYGIAKCWFAERYLELARRLIKRTNATIILVGGRDNAVLIDHIASNLNRRIIKAVGEDLLHLAALMGKCQLVITNDTGPMHVAAAVGTPLVAIFGSTDHVTTSPLGSRHRIIRKGVSCSPCLKRVCPEDHRCMDLISVDEVEKVVIEQLDLPAIERRRNIESL